MASEMIRTLQAQVEAFVAGLPFFASWRPGHVSRRHTDEFLIEFDHLVASFPPLLALAISRLGEGGRVVLAKNLFEECGEGDVARTHHAIYRRFLRSVGLGPTSRAAPHTQAWRDELAHAISESEPAAVVGLIAAGEVLAQPALSRIYDVVRPLYAAADVEYFTTHLELEVNHVAEIGEFVETECGKEPVSSSIQAGFERGLVEWRRWFHAMTPHAVD